jgi:hypothetical protein
MNARRYVDIFGLSTKRTAFVPLSCGVSLLDERVGDGRKIDGMTRVTWKALADGSSQHGKARRASVASNWVVAR